MVEILNGTRIGTLIQTILYLTGVPVYKEILNNRILTEDGYNYTRCYGELGCLEVKYAEARGFHLFPEKLNSIKPVICLYISDTGLCQLVTEENLRTLRFAGSSKTYWITHGYFENGQRDWIKELTHEILKFEKEGNVFVIDWSRGAQPPYTQATVNIELLGAYTASLMILIQDAHQKNVTDVHFIGHSLGAHFGGFVGTYLRENGYDLGRISGLDPAQPYFENFPEDIRLDPSDALFVDVIHTDAKPLLQGGSLSGLGTREPSGHADYYPNNGKDQPGCNDGVYQAILQENSLLYGMRRFLGCDHIRAYEYFTELINSPCDFMAFSCPTFEDLTNATCILSCDKEDPSKCNRMGFHAVKPQNNTIYYSITGSRRNYCRDHFVVKIDAENNEPSSSNQEFTIYSNYAFLFSVNFKGRHQLNETIAATASKFSPKIIISPSWSSPLNWFRRMSNDIQMKSVSILHLDKSVKYNYCIEEDGIGSVTMSTDSCHVNSTNTKLKN